MEQKPSTPGRRSLLIWIGVALLSSPVLVMIISGPKLGLFSGIAIALGAALVAAGTIRT